MAAASVSTSIYDEQCVQPVFRRQLFETLPLEWAFDSLTKLGLDHTWSATTAGSAGALVNSSLGEVETIAAPEGITPAIQAPIDALNR